MEKWNKEEIEKLLSERKQEYKQHRIKLPDTLEIIEHLLQQLDEVEKARDELVAEVNVCHKTIDLNGMVHDAVMYVLRGKQVSDFEESFGDVAEAVGTMDELYALRREYDKRNEEDEP